MPTTDAEIGLSIPAQITAPANDYLWRRAREADFEVEIYNRNAANKEKQADTGLATRLLADSYEHMQARVPDVMAVLVTGDGDYVPPIQTSNVGVFGSASCSGLTLRVEN